MYERNALNLLIQALFQTNGIAELEPLVPRYQEAAKAESARAGRLCPEEFHGFWHSARLHEVPCILNPF